MILLRILLVLAQLKDLQIMFKQSLKSSIGIYFFLIGTFTSNMSSAIANTRSISTQKLLSKDNIKFKDIPRIITSNNLELKSLQELVTSASYNLTSEISKRYPSLNLNANGLPQYLYGKNYNDTANTKTSQFKANPSLNLRWDLINPQRGLEINTARKKYEIARNNYEIKKYDLIQEAKSRYHNFHKSYENRQNASVAVDLSLLSLKDARSKLATGIGTKFDVLEANTQLLRDRQFLEEKNLNYGSYDIQTSFECPLVNEIIFDKKILDLVSNYLLTDKFFCYHINTMITKQSKILNPVTDFHRDYDSANSLTFFILLSNVNENNGATQIIEGSHKIEELDAKNENKKVFLNGDAGKVYAVDTWALHSGNKKIETPRLVTWIRFSSFSSRSYYHDKNYIFDNVLNKLRFNLQKSID